MRKINGPGAVGNAFVDYDPVTNPNGTVVTADYANDVQDELIGVQDYAGIAEAAGTNEYILASIKRAAIEYGKRLGEFYYQDIIEAPAEFDKDDPDSYHPGKCLDAIDGYEDIASANWPDLVTHMRAKALTYFDGITGEKSSFDVTGWAIVSNVATLTFANTTAENAILSALTEDELVHGGFSNWRSITLGSAVGDISAGEYAITDIDAASRTVDFTFVDGDNSGSGSFTANFYENRIPGSTTTARLYEATARSLVSANDVDGEEIAGLRRRDRFQGFSTKFTQNIDGTITAPLGAGGPLLKVVGGTLLATQNYPTSSNIQELDTNGTPRTGKTTDPRALIGHLYIHGRKYVA